MQMFNGSLAMNIMRNMAISTNNMNILGRQIASGIRLVSPSVDVAGFAISRKMEGQIRGLAMAKRNVLDGISLFQTADGALEGVTNMVQRIRELTIAASSDTNTEQEIEKIQQEIDQLIDEINKTPSQAQFNTKNLFSGDYDSANGGFFIQSGANAGQGTTFFLNKIDAESLGLDNFNLLGKTAEDRSKMIETAQSALDAVLDERSRIGAYQNRLEYTYNSLETSEENLSAAKSRIEDTDMAKAMMEYIQEQLKLQVSMFMLANLFQHERDMLYLLLQSL